MVGAGWYDETGIMLGSNFKRANILTNLNVVPRANLNIDARLYLAYTDRSRGAANTSFTKAVLETDTLQMMFPFYSSILL